MKLILIGPADTVKGGATISFRYLLEELDKEGIAYICLKTDATKTPFAKLGQLVKHVFKTYKYSGNETVISLHGSNKRVTVYSIFLNAVARITGSKLLIRVFGGNHDAYLNSLPSFYRKLIIQSYRKNVLLLQTKGLIKRFKNTFHIDDIIWFPTSRPAIAKYQKKETNTSKTLKVLFLGHIKEEKGIYDLLEIAKNAEQEDFDIQINLYGEPGDKKFLKKVSDSTNIKYGGVLEKDEVFRVMYHSDLFVFPSKYEGEGYPGVLIEAINCNLPVIATHHQYNSELIRDGLDGILYDPRRQQTLWTIIKALYGNRNKINYFIQNLRAKKQKFYSDKWNGDFFIKLLRASKEESVEGIKS